MVDSGWVEKFSIPLEHTFTAQPSLKLVDHINWNIQYTYKYTRLRKIVETNFQCWYIFTYKAVIMLKNIPVCSGRTTVSSCCFWVSTLLLCSTCVWRSPRRRQQMERPARCSRPSIRMAGARNTPAQDDERPCSVSPGLWHLWPIHCPRTVDKHTNTSTQR